MSLSKTGGDTGLCNTDGNDKALFTKPKQAQGTEHRVCQQQFSIQSEVLLCSLPMLLPHTPHLSHETKCLPLCAL